jgi:hypothetical protein
VLIVVLGFLQRLGEGFGSPLVFDEEAIWVLAGKPHIGPFGLLHGLALAYLAAVLIPREAGWMRHPAAQALAATGRRSLEVFCIGIVLSWVVTVGLRLHPGLPWLDPVLTLAGIAALVGYAVAAERRRLSPAPAAR